MKAKIATKEELIEARYVVTTLENDGLITKKQAKAALASIDRELRKSVKESV